MATRMSTPLLQRADLRRDADAAEDAGVAEAEIAAVDVAGSGAIWMASSRVGARISARGRFRRVVAAGWPTDWQDGQREGCRLAGAGFGEAEKIAAFHEARDGLGLDRGWSGIALR